MKIERNIPIPMRSSHGRNKSEETALALKMKPGDSILCPDKKTYHRCVSAIRKANLPYTSRAVEGGWRIWRLDGRSVGKKSAMSKMFASVYENGRTAPTL